MLIRKLLKKALKLCYNQVVSFRWFWVFKGVGVIWLRLFSWFMEVNNDYKDGPFTLTDGDHYFVLMADHKYNDESDPVEYSGMHHATIDSARMELAYAQGG